MVGGATVMREQLRKSAVGRYAPPQYNRIGSNEPLELNFHPWWVGKILAWLVVRIFMQPLVQQRRKWVGPSVSTASLLCHSTLLFLLATRCISDCRDMSLLA